MDTVKEKHHMIPRIPRYIIFDLFDIFDIFDIFDQEQYCASCFNMLQWIIYFIDESSYKIAREKIETTQETFPTP